MKETLIRFIIGLVVLAGIVLFVNTTIYFMPYSGYVLLGLVSLLFAYVIGYIVRNY